MRRVAAFPPQELSDTERLIAAALREHAERRSGKPARWHAVVILALVGVACWLVLVLGRVPHAGYIGIGLAVVAAVIAALSVTGLLAVTPFAPWGSAVRGQCPGCGQEALREGRVLHEEPPGAGPRVVAGIVTLCTADGCGHAAARKVRRLDEVPSPPMP